MMSKQLSTKGRRLSVDEKGEDNCCLSPYPLDQSYLLEGRGSRLDADGVLYHTDGIAYHPTTIARYALACWNHYMGSRDEQYRLAFLLQARWFVRHEVYIVE